MKKKMAESEIAAAVQGQQSQDQVQPVQGFRITLEKELVTIPCDPKLLFEKITERARVTKNLEETFVVGGLMGVDIRSYLKASKKLPEQFDVDNYVDFAFRKWKAKVKTETYEFAVASVIEELKKPADKRTHPLESVDLATIGLFRKLRPKATHITFDASGEIVIK